MLLATHRECLPSRHTSWTRKTNPSLPVARTRSDLHRTSLNAILMTMKVVEYGSLYDCGDVYE